MKTKLLSMFVVLAAVSWAACGGKGGKTSTRKRSSSAQPTEAYYELAFGEGYESVKKWDKGAEWTWTFDVKEAHAKVEFAFAAQMSSSSHSDRTLFTNHVDASSSDSFESNEENDGTARIEVKVNDVKQTLTTKTYGEAGLSADSVNYFRVTEFAIPAAGNYTIKMSTHASVGYRLLIGEKVRLYYPVAK